LWDFSTEGTLPDGKKFTVVVANHPSSPSQVSVLDPDGQCIGEYWHTGYIFDHELMDVDGDATPEVVLGGINNHYGTPALCVIRYDLKSAVSPTPVGFSDGLTPGKELNYVLLTRSDVAEVLDTDERIKTISVEGDILRVQLEIKGHPEDIESRVMFFDRNLKPVRIELPRSFVALHKSLENTGKLAHNLNEDEKQTLMNVESIGAKSSARVSVSAGRASRYPGK
jgi:hypothetical protein